MPHTAHHGVTKRVDIVKLTILMDPAIVQMVNVWLHWMDRISVVSALLVMVEPDVIRVCLH
jgi:hypothetical protein